MFQPVSRPLQPGVRFFRSPLPTAPTAFLMVRLPLPAALWAYPVPHKSPSGADPSSSPAADRPWRSSIQDHASPRTFWFKPVSTFGLLKITTFIGSSHTLVVPAHPLLLSAFVLADSALLRGSAYRISGGYVVHRASHRAVTGSACPGRERLMEQPVSSGNISSCETETHATAGRTNTLFAKSSPIVVIVIVNAPLPASCPVSSIAAAGRCRGVHIIKLWMWTEPWPDGPDCQEDQALPV